MTPTQASLKKNEESVYNNVLDDRKKLKPKFKIDEIVRTADKLIVPSKCDTISLS